MIAYTDHPLLWKDAKLGSRPPVRKVDVLSYDGNKYCKIRYRGKIHWIKSGYIHMKKHRYVPDPQNPGWGLDPIDVSVLPIEE